MMELVYQIDRPEMKYKTKSSPQQSSLSTDNVLVKYFRTGRMMHHPACIEFNLSFLNPVVSTFVLKVPMG